MKVFTVYQIDTAGNRTDVPLMRTRFSDVLMRALNIRHPMAVLERISLECRDNGVCILHGNRTHQFIGYDSVAVTYTEETP